MLKEAGQADAIISQVRLLADDDNIVLSSLRVELHELLTIATESAHDATMRGLYLTGSAYMKAIPTIPKPTTTTFLRCDGGLGYLLPSFSSSLRAFGGSLLTAMPGDEVAHDMVVEI